MNGRRHDIDWLRVIAMLVVFVFHCSRFFCTEGWHLKVPAAEQSEVLEIVRDMLAGAWQMELFFLVAGFATWYSLAHRTGGQYLFERVKRLLVPLYGVGLLILVVPQTYFEEVTNAGLKETFWHWLPSYYRDLPRNLAAGWRPWYNPATLVAYPFTGHLWFLQMLFVISLAALPLLLYLRSERGGRFIARLGDWVARPGGVYLFLVPLSIVQIALRWAPWRGRSWAEFFWYGVFFVIGYVLAADARVSASIKRHLWLYLGLWIGMYAVAGSLLKFVVGYHLEPGRGFSFLYVVHMLLWSVISWSGVAFMLSLGARYLTSGSRFLTYANEAVLPFYLFHQTIILTVGWFVLPLAIGNWARFLLITVISSPVIMILYEVCVRHIRFMRFLFGMAPQRQRAPRAREARPVGASDG
ncbi:MAG: acyltransferase family protein [Anaerolineae bacterium]|nr:acyltransferase family protein [Anaerolineae bacterium]